MTPKSGDPGPEVVSWGEPLAGIYPPGGCLIEDTVTLEKTYGGDASNFALAVAKLGHNSAMLTAVGNDPFGRGFLRLWESGGVNTSLVQMDDHHRTGVYFVSFHGKEHELTYYRSDSAACHLDLVRIDWGAIASAKVFHLSGLSQAISRTAMDASFELLAFARSNGLTISYDVNYRPAVWRSVELARAIIAHTVEKFVDILEVTAEEMRMLGWGERPEEIRSVFRRPPPLCVVKQGQRGSLLVSEREMLPVPALAVDVSDTVGAGDAYDAGIVIGLLENMDLAQMGRVATGVAAMVCRAQGPIDGQPTRSALDQFLASTRTS